MFSTDISSSPTPDHQNRFTDLSARRWKSVSEKQLPRGQRSERDWVVPVHVMGFFLPRFIFFATVSAFEAVW